MYPVFRSEEITAVVEAELLDKRLKFKCDEDIQEFWSDAKMVIRLGCYLARTIDYDAHWSKKICETLFDTCYMEEHLWPAETYIFISL